MDMLPVADKSSSFSYLVSPPREIEESGDCELIQEDIEGNFQTIFEHAGIGMAVIGINGKIIHSNRAYGAIIGYTAEELQHQKFTYRIHGDDMAVHLALTQELTSGKEESVNFESRYLHKQGYTVWVKLTLSAVRNPLGEPLFTIVTAQDITQEKKQHQELAAASHEVVKLEAANSAKTRFISSMSHELRTPLNSILGFSQIMDQDISLTPKQQEYLGIINTSGEYLLNLINDILSISKIETGQASLYETEFDFYDFLNRLEQLLKLKAYSQGLQLNFERGSNVPQYIKADEGKLRQILLNLLGNALKFTNRGKVTLEVNTQDAQSSDSPVLTFAVKDTGEGIAPEELDKLFKPFVQTETGNQSQSGTGLGLTISRELIHLMGGEITVKSSREGVASELIGDQVTVKLESPYQGTTFAFAIPVSLGEKIGEKKEDSLNSNRVNVATNPPSKYRILVAEDVAVNRKLLLKMMEPLGLEVREAKNGQEAVDIWLDWQPHLIWMDMQMPVMDGYEATKKIKQSPQGQGTVIIALTASTWEEKREGILAAGCDDFLSKPFEEKVLMDKISHHLRFKLPS